MALRNDFQLGDLSKTAEVTVNVINTWLRRDVLVPEAPDREGPRRFTRDDLIRTCALAEVNRIGIPPTQCRRFITAVEEGLEKLATKDLGKFKPIVAGLVWRTNEETRRPLAKSRTKPLEEDQITINAVTVDAKELAQLLSTPSANRNPGYSSVVVVDLNDLWWRTERNLRRLNLLEETDK